MRDRKIRIWDGKQMWYSGQTAPIVEVAITGQGIIANAWSQGGEHLLQIEVVDAMDFTGLHDKNNNPIYEGDIMNYGYDNKRVEFINGSFGVINSDNSFGSYRIDDGVIVGNIYESPLIK